MALRFRRRHGVGTSTDQDVQVCMVMGRLLNEWRDDPDRLAVAVWAYEQVLEYNVAAWCIHGLHVDDACDLVNRALYRRNRRVLRARAEGLVLGLQALAEDAEAWRKHEAQVGSAVIECRQLPIEERLAKLRAMDAEEAAGSWARHARLASEPEGRDTGLHRDSMG